MNDFEITENLDDLDAESKYLVHKAKDAAHHAYAPYSKFFVGAAALLDDGTLITGSNQENAAYPSGMCAERVVLYAAAAMHPGRSVNKLAVVAKKKSGKELWPATSCGSCRQVLLEFESKQNKPIQIIMLNAEHHWVKASSAQSLLPFGFTKENLEHGEKK